MFPVKPAAAAAGAIPLPSPQPAAAAVPLPGITPPSMSAPREQWEEESTRVAPLPSDLGGAVPLPGLSAPAPQSDFGGGGEWEQESTRVAPLPTNFGTGPNEAIPLPGVASPFPSIPSISPPFASAPAPDSFGGEGSWESESTRVAPLPTDLGGDPGAIPLPGAPPSYDNAADDFGGGQSQSWDSESTRVAPLPTNPYEATTATDVPLTDDANAIPLPGGPAPVDFGFDSSPAPVDQIPDASADSFDFGAPPTGSNDAYGAPAADQPDPYAFDSAPPPSADDGIFDVNAAVHGDAVALPGGQEAVALPPPPEEDFSVDSSAPAAAAIPLPGDNSAPAGDDFGFDLSGSASDAPPAAAAVDFVDAPPPPNARMPEVASAVPNFSFDDLPSPSGEAPPPSDAFSLDDLPAPPAAAPQPDFSMDMGDLPSPSAAAPAPDASSFNFDFVDAPPAPPAPAAIAPPPPAAPPPNVDVGADFGGIDFGSSEPASPSSAPSDDGLEFDPTASPRSSQGPGAGDDLEADLSAPLPPSPDKAADGLEMLSFIDDAAKDANVSGKQQKTKTRYHVRRKSGKVFGPFDEAVVCKMLEDGQLLGNEDVSLDNESWSQIGTIPAFSAAIQKLMESPSSPLNATATTTTGTQQQTQAQSMERLKNLYEGRMAAVAVVDKSGERARFRKRLPFYIVGGVVAVLLIAGASLGATRYGFFALKKVAPARIAAGTPQAVEFDNAKKALLADTFKSYTEAKDSCERLLAVKEYPEVRAVWSQAVFYLSRRYAAAEQHRAKAHDAMEDILLLGEKNAEVVKAMAGEKLASKDPNGALQLLQAAAPRQENANDVELQFLMAEAFAMKGEGKVAMTTLEGILTRRPDSAKALHALGNLHQAAGDAEKAATSYEGALKADGNHVNSAVELAAVELLVRNDAVKGAEIVARALDPKTLPLLGPAELARAHALNGVLLAKNFKTKEALAAFDEALKHDKDSVFVQANMARVLLGQRDFERALPLFKAAAEKQPKNLEYTDGYLSTLIALGKMNDALNVLGAANAQFPANARLAYLSGRVNDALDNAVQAESDYKRAINGDVKLVDPHLWLARFYLRSRRLNEARPQIEAAAQKAPESAAVQAGLGELALAEGKLDDAKAAFDRAVEKDPNLADSYLGLGRVAYERGDYVLALSQIDRAIELDANIKDGNLERGLVQWKLGKLDAALAELDKARAADPRSARIPMVIGAVKLDKGDLAGAEAAVSASLSIDPSNGESHYYLGRVKNRRSEHTQAIDSMKNALDRNPQRIDFHYWMGRVYKDAKKLTEAIAEWNTVVKLDPNHADALEALGAAHLERSEYEKAVENYQLALKADPRRTSVLASIGECHFTAGKHADAIAAYNQALKADPSLNWVYYKIGRSYTEQAQHAQAIGWYQKASKYDAENPMPFWYLGFAYKERGNKAQAISAFNAYLAKKPDAEDKRMIEDEIYDLEH